MHKDFKKISALTGVVLRKLSMQDLEDGERKVVQSFQADIERERLSEHKLLEFCTIISKRSLQKKAGDMLAAAHSFLPESDSILTEYVKTLRALTEDRTVERVLNKKLSSSPTDWNATKLLGRLYFHQDKKEKQLEVVETFLNENPRHLECLLEHADLKVAGNHDDAFTAIEKILQLYPTDIKGLSKKLQFLCQQGDHEKAKVALEAMEKNHPNGALTSYSRGVYLEHNNAYEKALSAYEEAFKRDPAFLSAYGKSGQMMLRLGLDLEEAWYRLESRFPQLLERPDGPIWRGEELKYKRLFIWAEQGIGDQIDFASMLRDLPNNLHTVNIECDSKLVPLFQRSFSQFKFHPRASKRDFPYDYNIPIGALARYLRTTYESFKTSPLHYLEPNPDHVEKWQAWLKGLGDGKKVGLTWRSGVESQVRAGHKLGLVDEFGDILSRDGLTFVSIFYGDGAEDIQDVENRLGVKIHVPPGLDQFNDLDETAALLKALDICFGMASAPVMLSKSVGTDTFVIGGADKVAPLWWPNAFYIRPDEKEKLVEYLSGS